VLRLLYCCVRRGNVCFHCCIALPNVTRLWGSSHKLMSDRLNHIMAFIADSISFVRQELYYSVDRKKKKIGVLVLMS
jgi:hypothetical protein